MTLEYSANLRDEGRLGELCRKLAQFMTALRVEGAAVFPAGGVRVRAIACEEYCIADGSASDAGSRRIRPSCGRSSIGWSGMAC